MSITVAPTAVSAKTSVNTDGYVAQHVWISQTVIQVIEGYGGVTHIYQDVLQVVTGGANAHIEQFVTQVIQTAIARHVEMSQFVVQVIVNPPSRGRITTFVIFPH